MHGWIPFLQSLDYPNEKWSKHEKVWRLLTSVEILQFNVGCWITFFTLMIWCLWLQHNRILNMKLTSPQMLIFGIPGDQGLISRFSEADSLAAGSSTNHFKCQIQFSSFNPSFSSLWLMILLPLMRRLFTSRIDLHSTI